MDSIHKNSIIPARTVALWTSLLANLRQAHEPAISTALIHSYPQGEAQ